MGPPQAKQAWWERLANDRLQEEEEEEKEMDLLSFSSLDEDTGGGKGKRSKGGGKGKRSKGGGKGKEGLSAKGWSKIKRAVTACLRYEYHSEMVSLDILWRSLRRLNWCTPEMLRRYFLEHCHRTGEYRFKKETRGDELFVRAIPSRRVLQETGDRRWSYHEAKRQGDAEKPRGFAAHEPKKRPSGPQQQPQHQEQKKQKGDQGETREYNGPSDTRVTLLDLIAAEAAAIVAEHAAVALAVSELAEDLKLTVNSKKRWKQGHFRELQRKWHPDKNQDRAKRSDTVFKYLMEKKEQYLTAAASSAGATPAPAPAAAGSAGATPAPKGKAKK